MEAKAAKGVSRVAFFSLERGLFLTILATATQPARVGSLTPGSEEQQEERLRYHVANHKVIGIS